MKFRDLSPSTRWSFLALTGLAGFLAWDQSYWWKLREEYAFGFIVPLFVAYVLYERWPRLHRGLAGWGGSGSSQPVDPARKSLPSRLIEMLALLMLVGGLFCFLAGALYKTMEGRNLISSNLLSFGFANIVLGTAYLLAGRRSDGAVIPLPERWNLALLFLFPAVIWMLSVPVFSAVHDTVSLFLMNKVVAVVYALFDVLGFAVVREGSLLRLPMGDVGVEDACSGIRSLTACLFAGSFLGAVYFEPFWKKAFLVVFSMIFAFINNIFRSLFLTGWAYRHGPGGLDAHVSLMGFDFGNVHDFTGWVVLGLTVAGLLILVKVLSIRLEYELNERGLE